MWSFPQRPDRDADASDGQADSDFEAEIHQQMWPPEEIVAEGDLNLETNATLSENVLMMMPNPPTLIRSEWPA